MKFIPTPSRIAPVLLVTLCLSLPGFAWGDDEPVVVPMDEEDVVTTAAAPAPEKKPDPDKGKESASKEEEKEDPYKAEEILIVSPTHRGKKKLDVAEKVNVVNGDDLERKGEATVTNAMRYEAGIRVDNGPLPFMENLSIRGFTGGRVLLTLDGVRTMTLGGIHGGGFNVDITNIKKVEVIRGPASTLYGSRAIGGVVNIVTLDPSERLDPGRVVGGKVTAAFKSNPLSVREAASVYGAHPSLGLEWQLGGSRQDAGQFTDSAGQVTAAGWDTTSGSGKILWKKARHRIELVGDYTVTNPVLNDGKKGMATPAAGKVYLQDKTWKEMDHYRIHAAYRYRGTGLLQSVESVIYWSGGGAYDYNDDEYVRSGKPYFYGLTSKNRDSGYMLGGEARATLNLVSRPFVFDLTVGTLAEIERYSSYTNKREIRYTSPDNLNIQEVVDTEMALYPNTDFFSVAGYALGEFSFFDCLLVTPGVRYDHFFISPDAGTPDFDPTGFTASLDTTDDWSLSPRLGVVYKLLKNLSFSAMVARGFYVTGASTRYYNFYHTGGGGFYIQGNPDLGPERSWNYELGAKTRLGPVFLSAAAFFTDADGFVDLRVGRNDEGTTVRRFENISNVRIWGAELELQARQFLWHFDFFANITFLDGSQSGGVDSFGVDLGAGRRQYPVVPWFSSATLRWAQRFGKWGFSVGASTRIQAQQLGTVTGAMSNVEEEPPDGFFLLDLNASADYRRRYRLNAGVTNLLNEEYQEPLNRLSYSAPRVFYVSAQASF